MMITNKTYLPTYQECVDKCNDFEANTFYENKYVIDGYNISLFNYRLATYNDFIEGMDARELRGLCFVFDNDGTYKRFLLLKKFFNLNQVPESLYDTVKGYEIKNIYDKADGSLASFIRLPNAKTIGKSKMGIDGEQATAINNIYNEDGYINFFVDYCLDNDIMPIFEYVSPDNRVVLRYKKEKLILIALRNNITGEYLDINDYKEYLDNIDIIKTENLVSLDRLIEINATDEDKEGYVIHTIDNNGYNFFYKLKNAWYRSRHNILTDGIRRENLIIGYILDDQIDDIISEIPKDETETLERIYYIIHCVKEEINRISTEIEDLYNILAIDFDVKKFALKYNKNEYFPGVMNKHIGTKSTFDSAIYMIRKRTKDLLQARTWLNNLK